VPVPSLDKWLRVASGRASRVKRAKSMMQFRLAVAIKEHRIKGEDIDKEEDVLPKDKTKYQLCP